jgi:hypothetical protein
MDTPILVMLVFAAALLLFGTLSRVMKSDSPEKSARLCGSDDKSGEEMRARQVESERDSARIPGLRQHSRQNELNDEDNLEIMRLLQLEKQRMPSASLEHCLAAAIARWESEKR